VLGGSEGTSPGLREMWGASPRPGCGRQRRGSVPGWRGCAGPVAIKRDVLLRPSWWREGDQCCSTVLPIPVEDGWPLKALVLGFAQKWQQVSAASVNGVSISASITASLPTQLRSPHPMGPLKRAGDRAVRVDFEEVASGDVAISSRWPPCRWDRKPAASQHPAVTPLPRRAGRSARVSAPPGGSH